MEQAGLLAFVMGVVGSPGDAVQAGWLVSVFLLMRRAQVHQRQSQEIRGFGGGDIGAQVLPVEDDHAASPGAVTAFLAQFWHQQHHRLGLEALAGVDRHHPHHVLVGRQVRVDVLADLTRGVEVENGRHFGHGKGSGLLDLPGAVEHELDARGDASRRFRAGAFGNQPGGHGMERPGFFQRMAQ